MSDNADQADERSKRRAELERRPTEPAPTAFGPDVSAPARTPAEKSAPDPSLTDPSSHEPKRLRDCAFGLVPGDRIGDFEILDILGEGAMGVAYLARQVSLDRLVALKATSASGSEARTMASLEHQNIVQVFSESVFRERDVRLLCMHYVAGATLEQVIDELALTDRKTWSGAALLTVVDRHNRRPTPFDPGALRERLFLERCDFLDAVAYLGARLAEALAYAHRQGVLHRDVKPANILINQYGRPMLADFGVASAAHQPPDASSNAFGGTLAYMSPEHLDAFNPLDPTKPGSLDERSDLYSLGIVLYETMTSNRPFEEALTDLGREAALRELSRCRHGAPPSLGAEVPAAIDRTLRRCLESDPNDRFPTGTELAEALDGCRELRRIRKEMPSGGSLTRLAQRRPLASLLALGLLPQALGSAINIAYNNVAIIPHLNPLQQAPFPRLVLLYNLLVYPIGVMMLLWWVLPAYRVWNAESKSNRIEEDDYGKARERLIGLPLWSAQVACLGWFPGIIFFPLGLRRLAGPITWDAFAHFVASLGISGLIAMTYSYFALRFITLPVLYPRLLSVRRDLRTTITREVAAVDSQTRAFRLLAGLIPLVGATLAVGIGLERFGAEEARLYRYLTVALIILGMVGFQSSIAITAIIERTLTALTGTRERPPSR